MIIFLLEYYQIRISGGGLKDFIIKKWWWRAMVLNELILSVFGYI